MSLIKIDGPQPEAAEEKIARPTFSTLEADKAAKAEQKKTGVKPRGPNKTEPSEMRVGRDWSQASWNQAFAALCRKWERANYSKRSEVK